RWTRDPAYAKETTQAAIAARAGARERSDLLDVLLEKGLPAEEIEMVVLSTLLAGFHTSGIGVSWTLYLLAQHPVVEAKLRAQLDALLGTRLAPTYEELDRLVYLEMVLNESMRRYPPAPFAARETPEEITLGSFKIPARTTILYAICCVHRDRRYWPDPDVFDPERFCVAAVVSCPNLAFIPFGVGQRSCSGMKPALLEMKLMLAMLVKTLSVRLVPGHRVVPVERFVLWSQDDIPATVARR